MNDDKNFVRCTMLLGVTICALHKKSTGFFKINENIFIEIFYIQ
jgi:hypothetical protein